MLDKMYNDNIRMNDKKYNDNDILRSIAFMKNQFGLIPSEDLVMTLDNLISPNDDVQKNEDELKAKIVENAFLQEDDEDEVGLSAFNEYKDDLIEALKNKGYSEEDISNLLTEIVIQKLDASKIVEIIW